MQFENMKARPKLLIDTTFSLRIETTVEQLRSVLDRVQSMLDEHPSIESGTQEFESTILVGPLSTWSCSLMSRRATGQSSLPFARASS